MSKYRDNPEDIEYKQTIPIDILICGILKDCWDRLLKLPFKVLSYLYNKLYFVMDWICSKFIFWPCKIVKIITYDIAIWLYDLFGCIVETSLNKQRFKMKDPGGGVKLLFEKYKKKYDKHNIEARCITVIIYMILITTRIEYYFVYGFLEMQHPLYVILAGGIAVSVSIVVANLIFKKDKEIMDLIKCPGYWGGCTNSYVSRDSEACSDCISYKKRKYRHLREQDNE